MRIGKYPAIAPTFAYVSDSRGLYSSSLVPPLTAHGCGVSLRIFDSFPSTIAWTIASFGKCGQICFLALVGPLAVAQTYYLDASDEIPSGTDETVDSAARHGAAQQQSKGHTIIRCGGTVKRELDSSVGPSAAVERLIKACDTA